MENYATPALVRLADSRRKVIENQKKKNYITRKVTIVEQFLFNLVPVVVTSTILEPLNRMKLLLQINKTLQFPEENARSLYNREQKLI